jgi:hypothetical protein
MRDGSHRVIPRQPSGVLERPRNFGGHRPGDAAAAEEESRRWAEFRAQLQ